MQSIHTLWIGMILHSISHILCIDPKFDPSTRMRLVLVPADAAVGSVIYRLRATDEEFDYPLQFELVGDSASSTVQIETLPCTKYNSVCQANVLLMRRLEPGRYYDFQVSVKDTKGGMAQQSCSITATNFTTPHDVIFPHKTGIIMIPEDAKRGTELDYVVARKNPLNPKPVYLELWGSPLFAIRQKIATPETTEGTIFLLGPLDFETQSMYHLTVLANDAYAEPGQDTRNIAGLEVFIIVEDVQDVPPIFTNVSPVTKIPAGLLPGDKVLQVHAEDGDKGNPREIRYGLVSEGNPFTSFFDINDTTGEIFLLQPLDEIAALTHIGDPVLLTIIAEEVKVSRDEPPAMATTVQIALFLPERSNSPPYFENDHYVARIDENSPQGTALIFSDPYVARVYDDDTGKNGVFSLTLLGNNGTFEISPNVAERRASFLIRVRDNQLLDYEMRHSVEFQILAQELGPATNLSAIVNVTVYINDVNDNPPVFDLEMYVIELPENMTAGTKVAQVHATDVDTGIGGRVQYTQILGYLNTSLYLNPESGLITVLTDNHGFDREMMPEYHFYIEARDNEGTGNRAQVPLIIKMIDVNDNAPIFEKSLYEFILSPDLRNFTTTAFIKAIDNDAEQPNNIVRYEIINGNYENKFHLNEITGQLTLREPLMKKRRHRRQSQQQPSTSTANEDVFVLTARAYDLGIPVLSSTTIIRIYPPESRARTVTFIVPGQHPDRKKTEDTLSAITGGRVIIHDIKPYTGAEANGATNIAEDSKDKSIVEATVLYDSSSVVDISDIQHKLYLNSSAIEVSARENSVETLYKAENRVLFWLLIGLALLIALSILTLLLCCICSWCPLYAAARKRVINRVNSTEDDVHLVHSEKGIGKQTKSVQVAEWMGRREAWSAEKSTDNRTKPTHWEFSRSNRQKLRDEQSIENEIIDKESEEKHLRKENIKNTRTAKETQFHNSRTNLINDRDAYIEDMIEDQDEYNDAMKRKRRQQLIQQQIDDDSMRRHEIDRGSDIGYNQRESLKRQMATEDANVNNRDQLFIKDGNAEILRLITRGKNEEENIYVNIPPPPQPQYIMVDNSGKEILMRRFIEEQANGKHIIREHYQIVPGVAGAGGHQLAVSNEAVHNSQIINDMYVKSRTGSIVYSQNDGMDQVKIIHANNTNLEHENQLQHAVSSQSLIHQELEQSIKQQNALLRQILLEKEKLEEKYSQQEVAMETQSLPGHSMTMATQTDCNAGTQTDGDGEHVKPQRRRARSENDDSLSDNEYEYVRYSPPNSPEGVYWIKRRRHKKRAKYKNAEKPRRRLVMMNDMKRKIRTPIKEESEEIIGSSPPPHAKRLESTAQSRQSHKSERSTGRQRQSSGLTRDVLLEIEDSLKDRAVNADYGSPTISEKRRYIRKVNAAKQMEYYEEGASEDDEDDEEDSDNDIVIRENLYSGDSLDEYSDAEELAEKRMQHDRFSSNRTTLFPRRESLSDDAYRRHISAGNISVASSPAIRPRLSRRDDTDLDLEKVKSRRYTSSEPPHHNHHRSQKGPAPKPPPSDIRKSKRDQDKKSRSETDLLQRLATEQQNHQDSSSRSNIPRYMEWYYNKQKDSDLEKKRLDDYKIEKERNKVSNKKMVGAIEKRIKSKAPKGGGASGGVDAKSDEYKYKPEPMPRTVPAKNGGRLLREDVQMNKNLASKIQTDTNHPLLQYSEHRYEHEYDPQPDIPLAPSKLPHYMYPQTPPIVTTRESKQQRIAAKQQHLHLKPKPSPIKEHEVKESRSKIPINTESNHAHHSTATTKQLNVSTLEDDHDSGIAMNSLLHNMGKRNPIADKKSVFTIAYDDVKVNKIQSESDSPLFS